VVATQRSSALGDRVVHARSCLGFDPICREKEKKKVDNARPARLGADRLCPGARRSPRAARLLARAWDRSIGARSRGAHRSIGQHPPGPAQQAPSRLTRPPALGPAASARSLGRSRSRSPALPGSSRQDAEDVWGLATRSDPAPSCAGSRALLQKPVFFDSLLLNLTAILFEDGKIR
jgi:hypothetical protein